MTSKAEDVRVWGIIPAAGMSRRMGRPKQLLAYRDSTMAATVTRTLLDAGVSGVVVVTRTRLVDQLDLPRDERVQVAVNDDERSEMIDSIRIGLAELCGTGLPACLLTDWKVGPTYVNIKDDGILVVPADMPMLAANTCRMCIAAFAADPQRIVIAMRAGRRGHPIIFPLSLRTEVGGLDHGLRELARIYPHRVHLVETGDPGVLRDVDTSDEYGRL